MFNFPAFQLEIYRIKDVLEPKKDASCSAFGQADSQERRLTGSATTIVWTKWRQYSPAWKSEKGSLIGGQTHPEAVGRVVLPDRPLPEIQKQAPAMGAAQS